MPKGEPTGVGSGDPQSEPIEKDNGRFSDYSDDALFATMDKFERVIRDKQREIYQKSEELSSLQADIQKQESLLDQMRLEVGSSKRVAARAEKGKQ